MSGVPRQSPEGWKKVYDRSSYRVDFNTQGAAERDAPKAERSRPLPPRTRYVYSGGVRYKAYDAEMITTTDGDYGHGLRQDLFRSNPDVPLHTLKRGKGSLPIE